MDQDEAKRLGLEQHRQYRQRRRSDQADPAQRFLQPWLRHFEKVGGEQGDGRDHPRDRRPLQVVPPQRRQRQVRHRNAQSVEDERGGRERVHEVNALVAAHPPHAKHDDADHDHRDDQAGVELGLEGVAQIEVGFELRLRSQINLLQEAVAGVRGMQFHGHRVATTVQQCVRHQEQQRLETLLCPWLGQAAAVADARAVDEDGGVHAQGREVDRPGLARRSRQLDIGFVARGAPPVGVVRPLVRKADGGRYRECRVEIGQRPACAAQRQFAGRLNAMQPSDGPQPPDPDQEAAQRTPAGSVHVRSA